MFKTSACSQKQQFNKQWTGDNKVSCEGGASGILFLEPTFDLPAQHTTSEASYQELHNSIHTGSHNSTQAEAKWRTNRGKPHKPPARGRSTTIKHFNQPRNIIIVIREKTSVTRIHEYIGSSPNRDLTRNSVSLTHPPRSTDLTKWNRMTKSIETEY